MPLELAENVIDEFIEGMEQEETIEEGRAALIAFKERYGDLATFKPVIEAIERVLV